MAKFSVIPLEKAVVHIRESCNTHYRKPGYATGELYSSGKNDQAAVCGYRSNAAVFRFLSPIYYMSRTLYIITVRNPTVNVLKEIFYASGGKFIAQPVCNTENILTFATCNQHSFLAPYLYGTDRATED